MAASPEGLDAPAVARSTRTVLEAELRRASRRERSGAAENCCNWSSRRAATIEQPLASAGNPESEHRLRTQRPEVGLE